LSTIFFIDYKEDVIWAILRYRDNAEELAAIQFIEAAVAFPKRIS